MPLHYSATPMGVVMGGAFEGLGHIINFQPYVMGRGGRGATYYY